MPRKKDKPKIKQEPIQEIKIENFDGTSPDLVRHENLFKSSCSTSINTPVINLCSSQETMEDTRRLETSSLIIDLSDSCSPPELLHFSSVCNSPCKRVTRMSHRLLSSETVLTDDDCPLSEVKKNRKRLSEIKNAEDAVRTCKKSKIELKSKQTPVSSKESNMIKNLELPFLMPTMIPIPPTDGLHRPKFNIVHADKSKKLAASSASQRNIKRARSPSPLKFDLVLRKGNNHKPRGRPRKKCVKVVLQSAYTETSHSKIKRTNDLCCSVCMKNLILVSLSQDNIEKSIIKTCIDYFVASTKPKLKAIENKGKPQKIIQKIQTCKVLKKHIGAPSHKVPTVPTAKIKKSISNEMPTLERMIRVDSKENLDSNTDQIDMDFESNNEPVLPNLTFSWDQQVMYSFVLFSLVYVKIP